MLLFFAGNLKAQKKSLLLDLTQTSLMSPLVVYNMYTPFTYNNHIAFLQLGMGVQYGFRKEYYNLGPFIINNAESYDDRRAVFAYSGATLRIGAFTGKFIANDKSAMKTKKILYAGMGGQLKYLFANNMKADYGYSGDNEDANRSYRYQDDKIIMIAPFFQAGVQFFKKKVMAEWYAGLQANIKFRFKEISKEYAIINHPYSVIESGPYAENEIKVTPTLLLGFRFGGILK